MISTEVFTQVYFAKLQYSGSSKLSIVYGDQKMLKTSTGLSTFELKRSIFYED